MTGKRKIIAAVVLLTALSATGRAYPGEGRSVTVFATEKMLGRWVGSSFESLSGKAAGKNECEEIIGVIFREEGFSTELSAASEESRPEARRLHTVIGRYADVSSIPNDVAAKAASLMSGSPDAVVLCGVNAQQKKSKAGPATVCAKSGCKAVSVLTKRRVATSSDERCATNDDRSTASMDVVRQSCTELGRSMALKLKSGN